MPRTPRGGLVGAPRGTTPHNRSRQPLTAHPVPLRLLPEHAEALGVLWQSLPGCRGVAQAVRDELLPLSLGWYRPEWRGLRTLPGPCAEAPVLDVGLAGVGATLVQMPVRLYRAQAEQIADIAADADMAEAEAYRELLAFALAWYLPGWRRMKKLSRKA